MDSCLRFTLMAVVVTFAVAAPPVTEVPHCRNIGCCDGRDDECFTQIADAQDQAICYCDEFCLRGDSSDCCIDFNSVCVQGNIDLAAMFTKLSQSDENRIDNTEYNFELQEPKADYNDFTDQSAGSLFASFNEDVFNKGTYKSFLNLCDNYEIMQGVPENDTDEERAEVQEYLDSVMDTEIMRKTRRFLKDAGYISGKRELREKLETIWFTPYARQAENDSSAFEHVFCGELKSPEEAQGMHSWVTFYHEEKAGNLNYHGYSGKRADNVITTQFTWHGATKPRSTIMLGVSTEFELAVFTAAWLSNPDEVSTFTVSEGGTEYQVDVQTWTKEGSEEQISTAYFKA